MKPYAYTKSNPEAIFIKKQLLKEKGRRALSTSFMLVGMSLFTYVGGNYYLWTIKEAEIATRPGLGQTLANAPKSAFTNGLPIKNKNSIKDASFASASEDDSLVYPTFNVTIPRIKLKDGIATSDVMSNNEEIYKPVLLRSLAHYKGSAYPGGEGNVIIYGHSILPTFYNPKNYMSVFSTLDKMESKDPITVRWGDKNYTYLVEGMEVVDPKDTRVLMYKNGKTLTLITCEPPGLATKRLLVFARLSE
ncbi:MAG: class E sortase [bacterium]|nr:class E sortase [bacterium]